MQNATAIIFFFVLRKLHFILNKLLKKEKNPPNFFFGICACNAQPNSISSLPKSSRDGDS